MKCTICGKPDMEGHHYVYDPTGAKDDTTHSVKCKECDYVTTEGHNFSNGSCTDCGTKEPVKQWKLLTNVDDLKSGTHVIFTIYTEYKSGEMKTANAVMGADLSNVAIASPYVKFGKNLPVLESLPEKAQEFETTIISGSETTYEFTVVGNSNKKLQANGTAKSLSLTSGTTTWTIEIESSTYAATIKNTNTSSGYATLCYNTSGTWNVYKSTQVNSMYSPYIYALI